MTDTSLNYHHLRCFVSVVEEGGVAAAATRLHVTHPTISEQIRRLEESLGLPLFERAGRKLVLNDSGQMVFEYAAQIFGIGSALVDAVEGRMAGRNVLCRVGVDSVLAKLSVRQALSPLMDALGESLRLRCTEEHRDALVAQLRGRQLDLVLTDAPALDAAQGALKSAELTSSGIAFFAHSDVAARLGRFPRGLDGAPFLLPMPGTRLRRELERWLGQQRIRPRVVGEMADSALLKAFGQDGRGVFAMPESVQSEVVAQYNVQVIGHARDLTARLFAVHRTDPDIAVRRFLALHSHESG